MFNCYKVGGGDIYKGRKERQLEVNRKDLKLLKRNRMKIVNANITHKQKNILKNKGYIEQLNINPNLLARIEKIVKKRIDLSEDHKIFYFFNLDKKNFKTYNIKLGLFWFNIEDLFLYSSNIQYIYHIPSKRLFLKGN